MIGVSWVGKTVQIVTYQCFIVYIVLARYLATSSKKSNIKIRTNVDEINAAAQIAVG